MRRGGKSRRMSRHGTLEIAERARLEKKRYYGKAKGTKRQEQGWTRAQGAERMQYILITFVRHIRCGPRIPFLLEAMVG